MTILLKESFKLNNSIAISKLIKKVPFFYLYFNPIISFKLMDLHQNIITDDKKSAYKLIKLYNNDNYTFEFDIHVPKSIYHIFLSSEKLQQLNCCFIVTNNSFINNSDYPVLNNFSQSINLNQVNISNIKSYFPKKMLSNIYVPIDIFIISYIIHNNIERIDKDTINNIIALFISDRQFITIDKILPIFIKINGYHRNEVINYLFKYNYTWSNMSIMFFLIKNYNELLNKTNLYSVFDKFISHIPEERDILIINKINDCLFNI